MDIAKLSGKDLVRAVKARREECGISLRLLSTSSGYYRASMLSTLERSLKPGGPKVQMSERGARSLRAWLAWTYKVEEQGTQRAGPPPGARSQEEV